MGFPQRRMRRLRSGSVVRRMLRETVLTTDDFIMPLFVVSAEGVKEEIGAMPGQYHYSLDMLPAAVEEIIAAGIKAVLLFGSAVEKDSQGSEAWAEDGVVPQAVRLLKKEFPGLLVITDLCLCAYTEHGHCGVVNDTWVDNDRSVASLCKVALAQARAGADFVAPSDMMDGRVQGIRTTLDKAGFEKVGIISYSTKFASAYYGPFREAADSAPQFGDRKSYQMQPGNSREAVLESLIDEEEGADMLMVKPALAYLDIIRALRESTLLPVVCYNVSGEYSMVKAAAEKGWINEREVVLETLLGMKRAGADLIISYHACDAARWLNEEMQQ